MFYQTKKWNFFLLKGISRKQLNDSHRIQNNNPEMKQQITCTWGKMGITYLEN